MFCQQCGTEVTEGAFCPKCGAKVIDVEANGTSTVQQSNEATTYVQPAANQGNQPTTGPAKTKSKNIGKIIGIVAVVLVAILAVSAIVRNHKTTVDLDKYAVVEFDGYDTLGTANVAIDWEAFDSDYTGKIKVDKKALRQYIAAELSEDVFGAAVSSAYVNEYLSDILSDGPSTIIREFIGRGGQLDEYSNLSNGDEVTFTWDIDEDDLQQMARFLKCKFKYSDELKYIVSGLEQVGTFDPFTGIEIVYSGIAPDGHASLDYDSGDYGYYLSYSLDKKSGLSNGDTITVTVSISGTDESFVENYGKLPSPTEKTYTVDGLMEYVSSTADIPDELMAGMQSQAEDIINAMIAKNWDEEVDLKSLTYLGNYYLTAKNQDTWGDLNRCCLVYKITATMNLADKDDNITAIDQDSYYYVIFKDLMKEEDGTGAVDISQYYTTSNRFKVDTGVVKPNNWYKDNYTFYYYGFESLDKLYNEVVTKNLESFSHEDNVSE